MRTREVSYWDYGISEAESKELLKKCQNADSDTEKILLRAAQESNENISAELFYSLRNDISFEKLDAANKGLCIDVGDFYAYRRKAVYLFKEKLMEQDREVIDKLQNDGYIRRYCSIEDAAGELQTSENHTRTIAKRANALVKLGNLFRINMVALYDYIDREYAVQ